MDIRKYGIAIAITILTAILIYAIADAIAGPTPEYNNCWNNRFTIQSPQGPQGTVPMKGYVNGGEINCTPPAMDITQRDTCTKNGGDYMGIQGQDSCVVSYECSMCNKEYNDAQQHRNAIFFYASIATGIIAIIIGFLLPLGAIHEWVGFGAIFGGVIGLFIGTVSYWSDLARIARPFVIAGELAVLLFIIYRRMNIGQGEPKKTELKKKK